MIEKRVEPYEVIVAECQKLFGELKNLYHLLLLASTGQKDPELKEEFPTEDHHWIDSETAAQEGTPVYKARELASANRVDRDGTA